MLYVLPYSVVASTVRNVFANSSLVTNSLIDRYFDLQLREGNRLALIKRFRYSDEGSRAYLIKKVSCPTLILWGGKDELIQLEDAYKFQRDIIGAKLVVFDDLGHVPMEEGPFVTIKTVLSWLESKK